MNEIYTKKVIDSFKYFFAITSDEELIELINWVEDVAAEYDVPHLNTRDAVLYMLFGNMNRLHLSDREEINTKGRDYVVRVLKRLKEVEERQSSQLRHYYETKKGRRFKNNGSTTILRQ